MLSNIANNINKDSSLCPKMFQASILENDLKIFRKFRRTCGEIFCILRGNVIKHLGENAREYVSAQGMIRLRKSKVSNTKFKYR